MIQIPQPTIRRHHSALSSPICSTSKQSHLRSSNLSSSYSRAASYSGYLPEIVVTNAELFAAMNDCNSVSRPISCASSSVFSFDEVEEEEEEEEDEQVNTSDVNPIGDSSGPNSLQLLQC